MKSHQKSIQKLMHNWIDFLVFSERVNFSKSLFSLIKTSFLKVGRFIKSSKILSKINQKPYLKKYRRKDGKVIKKSTKNDQ